MESSTLTAALPHGLVERIARLAQELGCSADSIVEQALTDWIEIEEEQHRLTREAMTDIDRGHTVDHAVIQAWADSLGSDHPLPPPA